MINIKLILNQMSFWSCFLMTIISIIAEATITKYDYLKQQLGNTHNFQHLQLTDRMNQPLPLLFTENHNQFDSDLKSESTEPIIDIQLLSESRRKTKKTKPKYRKTAPKYRETAPKYRETAPKYRETAPKFKRHTKSNYDEVEKEFEHLENDDEEYDQNDLYNDSYHKKKGPPRYPPIDRNKLYAVGLLIYLRDFQYGMI